MCSCIAIHVFQGCSVKVRDHAGWTPLHEVCNRGYLEIAELLIKHGADVDDRGGKDCEGMTPLHDAATNGHLDVLNFLVRKAAANVHAKDDKVSTSKLYQKLFCGMEDSLYVSIA